MKVWIATAGLVLLAVLAGLALPVKAYMGLVAALVLLACVPILFMFQIGNPFWGFALLVVTAVTFPLEFRGPSGVMMGSSFPLVTLLCGIWLLKIITIDRSEGLDRDRSVYAIVTFMGVAVLAFASGQYPWFPWDPAPLPAQVAELALFLLSGCLFLATAHQLNGFAQLRWLTWMFLAAGTLVCGMQVLSVQIGIVKWAIRPVSVGSLFWTWLVAVSFGQALFNSRLSPWVRLGMLGITAMVFYHGLIQVRSWASGWIPALIALGVILALRLPRTTIGLGLVSIPLGLFLMTQFSEFFMADEEYSLMTRQEAWRVMWQLIERSPVLGLGPANYYYYTENVPLLGWYVRFISHNNYEDLLAQTGFLGLIAFCWVAFEILWLAWRVYLRAPAGFAQAYVVGGIGGIVGSLASGMLGDWIIPFYYNAGIIGFRSSLLFWVFTGTLLALKRIISAQEAATSGLTHFSRIRDRKLVQVA